MKNGKLAINGGTPVFAEGEFEKNIPVWPIPLPETEKKLIDIYRSSKWSMRAVYEPKLMTDFAAFQDAKYALWMCNGTTTLECALLALDIGPGDEVIVPGITWIATAEAPIYVGAKPVIIDVDPDTMCMDPAKIEEAITPRTKAIIPVHIYSALADMDRINAIAKKHHLHVIEDAAHGHGAKQHGKGAGSLSEIGSFSFQQTKLMTGGEGGCCITSDERLADRLFRLSHIGGSIMHGNVPLETGLMCHQYRFTEFQAAIIYDQLQHQAEYREKREKAVKIINGYIKDIPSVKLQKSAYADDTRCYYFFSLLLQLEHLKPGVDRGQIFKALNAEGVCFGVGWGSPLYKSPAWNIPEDRYVKHPTPVCEDIMYKRLVCRMHPFLFAEQPVLERCGEAIRKVMLACTK